MRTPSPALNSRRTARLLQRILWLMQEISRLYTINTKDEVMPLYSWKCSKCAESVDVVRTLADYSSPPGTDEVSKECTDGDHTFVKQIGNTSFKLAGTGWARDGYTK